jgi:hypothetical protein
MTLLCALVAPLPIGTNLGLLHLFWMLLSGQLLASRGAIIPGMSALGLPAPAVRRAWAALGQGAWASDRLLARWAQLVADDGQWQGHAYEGYEPLAADLTGFWRPRLRGCPTRQFHPAADKSLPAIVLGLIARVGSVHGQRLALPLAFVRADPAAPTARAHQRALLEHARRVCAPDQVLVVDGGFGVALLQEVGVPRYVARLPKHFTARRALPVPPPPGRRRGAFVRPRARLWRGQLLPATPPDAVVTWAEGTQRLRAERWTDLVLPKATPGGPRFQVYVISHPAYPEPLALATSLPLSAPAAWALYRDRWPIEQLPLAAKQMLGAARHFVHAPETCQRWPEVALLAGALLSYAAATEPAVATGWWDRRPRRTPGRLRRLLARAPFPHAFPCPARIRPKAAVTAHLPKGWFGQRRPPERAATGPPHQVA